MMWQFCYLLLSALFILETFGFLANHNCIKIYSKFSIVRKSALIISKVSLVKKQSDDRIIESDRSKLSKPIINDKFSAQTAFITNNSITPQFISRHSIFAFLSIISILLLNNNQFANAAIFPAPSSTILYPIIDVNWRYFLSGAICASFSHGISVPRKLLLYTQTLKTPNFFFFPIKYLL
jgi:hypothetical protein